MQASLVQLRQRISTICRLEPLSTEETIAYIDYRLQLAGYDGEPLFTEDALKLITEASHGTPRTINNLCFNALSLCCALKSQQVDDRMVAEVIADLQLSPQLSEPIAAADELTAEQPSEPKLRKPALRSLRFWVPAAAVLLVMCVLGVQWLTGLRVPWSHAAADDRSLNLNVLPTSVPAAAAPDTSETMTTNLFKTQRRLKSQSNPIKRLKRSPCNTWEASTYIVCIKSRRSIRS